MSGWMNQIVTECRRKFGLQLLQPESRPVREAWSSEQASSLPCVFLRNEGNDLCESPRKKHLFRSGYSLPRAGLIPRSLKGTRRTRTGQVSKVMKEKRQETLERITTEYGTKLKMNRSIQAEGSFAVVKEDMGLRQYLYRGRENALAQSVIAAIAHNINKLHFKIQSGRTGQFLTELRTA